MSSKKHSETKETIPVQLLKEAHATLDQLEGCARHLPHGSPGASELIDQILKLRRTCTSVFHGAKSTS